MSCSCFTLKKSKPSGVVVVWWWCGGVVVWCGGFFTDNNTTLRLHWGYLRLWQLNLNCPFSGDKKKDTIKSLFYKCVIKYFFLSLKNFKEHELWTLLKMLIPLQGQTPIYSPQLKMAVG